MIENKNINLYEEPEQNKGKSFWKQAGVFALALLLAVITVIVINVG